MTNWGLSATYKSFVLENAEIQSLSKTPKFSDAGSLESYDISITVRGYVYNANAAAYTARLAELVTNLEQGKQDFTLKNQAGTTLKAWTTADFSSGQGPFCEYQIEEGNGYNFYLVMTISGNAPPQGTGNTVDDYTDSYSTDATGIKSWTRQGTLRSATAWADEDAALAAADPEPSTSLWEFVSKDGKLDSDKKLLEYSFVHQQFWKERPGYFKKCSYNISTAADGRKKNIRLSATVAPEFTSSGQGVEELEEQAADWARGEMPGDAVIENIETDLNPRTGECSVSIQALAECSGDIIEWSQEVERAGEIPHVVHVPMDGSNPWVVTTGGKVSSTSVSGHIVGLRQYHDGDITLPTNAFGWRFKRRDPELGPDGELNFAVDYSYFVPENLDVGGGGGGDSGGKGGANATGRSGRTGSWNPSASSGGKLTFGDIGGFTTAGLVQGAVGGLFGTSPKTQIKFRIF